MFSDHMRKIDTTSGRTLLMLAAVLVIVCQLIAMALVADGQVKKADLRESNLNSQRMAMARCFEVNPRFDRDSCLQQASVDTASAVPEGRVVSVLRDTPDEMPPKRWSGTQASAFGDSPQVTRSLMPVAFN